MVYNEELGREDEELHGRRPLRMQHSLDELNSRGLEIINTLAGYFGHSREWLEHLVTERLDNVGGCKCELGHESELAEPCRKWVAIKRYKDAEQALDRAQRELESAERNLSTA